MNLIFQNSKEEERIIASVPNVEEAGREIKKFLDSHNFKSHYTRVWEENGRIKIDVGSWSEFIFFDGITFEEYQKAVQ